MKKKLVSVIITTHNRSDLLKRAIDSALNQSYKNIELIISDDASSDDTEEVVKKYMNNYNNIIYRKNEFNKGACYTRNRGIELASGEFITGLDDDDEFESNRIEYFLEKYDDKYAFLCSNINIKDKLYEYKMFIGTKEIKFNDLFWYNYVGNQVFIKKDRINALKGFDETLDSAQDLDLWIRILKKYGKALRLNEATYNLYIDHDKPRITTSSKKINGLKSFFSKHRNYMNNNEEEFYKLKIKYWENNCKYELIFFKYINFQIMKFALNFFMSKFLSKLLKKRRDLDVNKSI